MSIFDKYFFNTNKTPAEELPQENKKAKKQTERILDYYKQNKDNIYTPSEILNNVFNNTIPITSVRRAMTTLTYDKKLLKTDITRKGMYGKPNYCWKLNNI